MPIGLLFYAPADNPAITLAVEASEVVRFGLYSNGNVDIRTKQGESLESVTPLEDLIENYNLRVSEAQSAMGC